MVSSHCTFLRQARIRVRACQCGFGILFVAVYRNERRGEERGNEGFLGGGGGSK